jgi:hypothetical protein
MKNDATESPMTAQKKAAGPVAKGHNSKASNRLRIARITCSVADMAHIVHVSEKGASNG